MRKVSLALTVILTALLLAAPAQASTEKWHKVGNTYSGLLIQANQYTSTKFGYRVGNIADLHNMPRKVTMWSTATHRYIVMRRSGTGYSDPFDPITYRGGNHAAIRFLS